MRILAAPAIACTLSIAASAAALPPEMGWTKKDDPFIAHVNIERIAGSILAPILSEPLRVEDGDEVWRRVAAHLPLELGKDVRSVTLLSAGPLEEDLVIISRMSARADLLPDALAEHVPGYRAIEIEGHIVHSWAELVDEKRRHIYGHIRNIGADERLVLISTGWEYLLDTIAFTTGEEAPRSVVERIDGVPGPMAESAVYIYAPAEALHSGEGDLAKPHLEDAKWLVLDLGATAEHCTLRAVVDLGNEEKATDFAQFAQGMLALGKMVLRDDESMKPVVQVLNMARVASGDSTVTVQLRAPSAMFASALDATKLRVNAMRDSGRFGFQIGATAMKATVEGQE